MVLQSRRGITNKAEPGRELPGERDGQSAEEAEEPADLLDQ